MNKPTNILWFWEIKDKRKNGDESWYKDWRAYKKYMASLNREELEEFIIENNRLWDEYLYRIDLAEKECNEIIDEFKESEGSNHSRL